MMTMVVVVVVVVVESFIAMATIYWQLFFLGGVTFRNWFKQKGQC